jgi:galactose mutarotase-like enzyme
VSPVDLRVWQGEIAVTLRADEYRATFLPGCGMLCTSLQYRGEEYVAWPRSLAQYRSGHVSAIPLVHPWGNRLGDWGYRAAGKRVDLRDLDLSVDPNGLPIHGNLWCAPFEIAQLHEGRLRAGFDYGADPERSAAFPFPHIATVDARLTARGLRITTEIEPTGRARIPISFCWHPYLRLPEGSRRDWVLRWPACEHVEVDERTIPTGTRVPQRTQRAPIAGRLYDDHYALGADHRFSISGAGRSLTLRFDDGYPFAQLFVPPRREFVAIEPMTATIGALGTDSAPVCRPGERFRAAFTITCRA